MSHKLEFTTIPLWTAYAGLSGEPGPTSPDPTTSRAYTVTQAEQALFRATAYINNAFYRKFKPENMADTFENLPENVQEDLREACNIAASHELVNPGTYSVTIRHNVATGQEIKKFGPVEYFKSEPGNTVQRVNNEQTLDFTIHSLLDGYLLVPAGLDPNAEPGFRFAAIPPDFG
ncbi:MAG: hypothetical protein K0U41_05405 [Gammaproteobacteria bacterium]|nr:hypothetical protein [Gammaproteobacteria bacterium]